MRKSIAFILAAMTLASCTSLASGWKALSRGDYSGAREIAAFNLAKDPMNAEVYRLTASTYLAEKRPDEATRSAKFAVMLDETNAEASALLQKAYAAGKDWGGMCDEVERASRNGAIHTSNEQLHDLWHEGAAALLSKGQAEGWSCFQALRDANADVSRLPEPSASRRAYANALVRRGRFSEAIALLETSTDPYDSLLSVSAIHYKRFEREPARRALRQWVEDKSHPDIANRLEAASETAQNGRDYEMADEILNHLNDPEHALDHAIVKLHLGQKEEARSYVQTWFSVSRETESYLSGLNALLMLGFPDLAWEGCEHASFRTDDTWFAVADAFSAYGFSSNARHAVETFAESHRDQADACMDAAAWFTRHRYLGEAIRWSERALHLGTEDAAFTRTLLDLYGQTRDFRSLQRGAAAYLVTQTTRPQEARCEVAQIYFKYNDTARAFDLLSEAAKSGDLEPTCDNLYLKLLQKNQQYETLYALLEKKVESGSMTRLKMAAWFETSAQTEKEFKQSLAPLRTDTAEAGFRRDAEYLAASYAWDILGQEKEADEALGQMLKATDNLSSSFDMAASFWMSRKQYDKALAYARQWHERHPSEAKVHLFTGTLQLRISHYNEAAQSFDTYVDMAPKRRSAIATVMNEYKTAKAEDEAFAWFLDTYTRMTEASPADSELLSLYAETLLNESIRLTPRSPSRAQSLKDEALSTYDTLITQDSDNSRIVNYGQALQRQDQYALACRAYDKAQNSKPYTESIRLSHIKACLKSGCDDPKLRHLLSGLTDASKWTTALSLLREANRLDLAQSHFEAELVSSNAERRTSALNELITLSLELGNPQMISEALSRFEAVSPAQPQTRTALFQAATRLSNWDEAVRHLTFLIQNRPDTRETFEHAVRLSRLVPERSDVQKLFKTMTLFAEGSPHRLQWLAESYENLGLHPEALHHYLLADAASPVAQEQLQFHILLMSISLGQSETTAQYRERIEKSALWNHERIYQLSRAYEAADDLQNAYALLTKAIELAPENVTYRSHHLQQALRSRNTGLIMNALSEAIRQPTAEVMMPLVDEKAWLDAMDAIDQFLAIGQYDMATASLIWIEQPYIQRYGQHAYMRKLMEISANAVQFAQDAETTLSRKALESEHPEDSLAYLPNVLDGKIWANALIRHQTSDTALGSLLNLLDIRRSAMSANARNVFDQDVYNTLVAESGTDTGLSDLYAERFGILPGVSQAIRNAISGKQYVDAARKLSLAPLDTHDYARSLAELAAYGYFKEALDMAKKRYESVLPEDRPQLALIRLMLGEQSPQLDEALAELDLRTLQAIPADSLARILHASSLKRLFQTTPVTAYDTLIHAACRHAVLYPDDAARFHALIREAILSHPIQSSLWLSYSRRALNEGFTQEALEAIQHAEMMLPDNALVQYRKAVILDQSGQPNEAMEALNRGMLRATNVVHYLQEARTAALQSSYALRETIANHQLSISPHQIQPKLDLLETLLMKKDFPGAADLAESIYNSADIARTESVVSLFKRHQALTSLPAIYTSGQASSAYRATAYLEFEQKNVSSAATAWHEAAKRALWPLDVYREALETIYTSDDKEALEQIAQLTMQTLPHAPEGYLWQSIVLFQKNHTDTAIQWLEDACRHAENAVPVLAKVMLYSPESSQEKILSLVAQKRIDLSTLKSAIVDEIQAYGAPDSEAKAKRALALLEALEPSHFVPYKNAFPLSQSANLCGQQKMADTWLLSSELAELSKVL